jgi:pyrroloquinoline quinone biosynthesis protein D
MSALTKLTERFVETDIDEEIIIMRLDNGELLTLSGTAASMWRLIDGSRDRVALLAALTDEFAVAQADIVPDVDAFLQGLREAGLLADI